MPAATSCTSAKNNQCYADLWSKNKASLLGDILGVDKISHFQLGAQMELTSERE